jgi:hypothetical protein
LPIWHCGRKEWDDKVEIEKNSEVGMRKVEDRRWEVEKMRRSERLAAAKKMTTQQLVILREQKGLNSKFLEIGSRNAARPGAT